MATQTIENDRHPAASEPAAIWRIAPLPAIIGKLDRAAQRGSLQRWSYILGVGLSLIAVVALLTLYVTILPDGASTEAIANFFRDYNVLLKIAMGFMGLVFMVLLFVSGGVASKLYPADTSPGHRMSWIGFASDLALIVYFALEVGIMAANVLLVDHVSDEMIHALHVVTFASAYMLGPLWIPFFISFVVISRRGNVFPTWLNWFAVFAAITNGLAWFGFVTLTGPLNAMNGLVSLGGPTVGPIPFVVTLGIYLIMQERPAGLSRLNAQLTKGSSR